MGHMGVHGGAVAGGDPHAVEEAQKSWRVVVESRLLWTTGVPHVQSDRDKTFIQQVFYGCMRYSKVLKVRGIG